MDDIVTNTTKYTIDTEILPQYKDSVDWRNENKVSSSDVYTLTKEIHRDEVDFDEGDLGDRIYKYDI